jgi:hypothetical protein
MPKIDIVETCLRKKVVEVSEKRMALKEQGRFLKTRLDACIIFNGDELNRLRIEVEDLRLYVEKLSRDFSAVKQLLLFNSELIRQRLVQVCVQFNL